MTAVEAAPGSTSYGHVDPATREYVVTRPDTPTPWINYLGAGHYGGIVSNTGGGYSFDRDPRNRRVTRYRYNAVPVDQPGRYVYLRDQETGEYWSPTWQPVRTPLDAYECRHGPGYTRIAGSRSGIDAELLYFVPPARAAAPEPEQALVAPVAGVEAPAADPCPCELWVLTLRNAGRSRRTIRTFTYAEFGYADALADQHNLDWTQHIVGSRFENGTILAGTRFRPTTWFLGSSEAPLGFTGDRDAFVGPYRDLAGPLVVENGAPTNEGSPRGNSVGSLCHEIVLAPGEERRLVFVLGITDEPAAIAGVVARFSDPAEVDAAFGALRADWDAYLSRLTVETPDPDTNAMLDTWNQVQCRTTLYWSRFVSGYETGVGRGMGTRDVAQDVLGTLHAAPGEARERLLAAWAMQFRDGHAWHQFFPLTGEGGPGLAAERPECPQWFSDDHLWLVLATCAYLRETGDLGFLRARARYADAGDATVWRHVLRAVAFTRRHRGPHGLPRAGYADWDDTLNVDHGSGRAESVWTAMQWCRVMLDLAALCEHTGRAALAARFGALHAAMAAAVNGCAWDGAWYARAFDDDGRPIGVASEARHRINLNTQTWSVIGGVAPPERAFRALASAVERLDTPFGMALLWPPYDGADDRVRGTSTFPPGAKENGGIFCHAHAWMIVASAMLGRGDEAFDQYRRILPLARTDADRYRAEPYVYAQNLCGPAHPQFGMARNAWLTGTAAWTFVAATQWILGVRPAHDGLIVAPVIPTNWPGFRMRRRFRGADYEITVRREGPGSGVTLEVDGQRIDGRVVPLPAPGATRVVVEAVIR